MSQEVVHALYFAVIVIAMNITGVYALMETKRTKNPIEMFHFRTRTIQMLVHLFLSIQNQPRQLLLRPQFQAIL